MRKLLSVVAAVVALSSIGAASASAAHLTLLSGRAAWIGQLDAGTLAWGDSRPGSGAEVLGTTGGPRAVAAPAGGCGSVAAGEGHLLFDCPTGVADRYHEVVTGPDGAVQASVEYGVPPEGDRRAPYAVGGQWILQYDSRDGCGAQVVAYNWATGSAPGMANVVAHTAGTFEDPNAPGLGVSLCAPLQRAVTSNGPGSTSTPRATGSCCSRPTTRPCIAAARPRPTTCAAAGPSPCRPAGRSCASRAPTTTPP